MKTAIAFEPCNSFGDNPPGGHDFSFFSFPFCVTFLLPFLRCNNSFPHTSDVFSFLPPPPPPPPSVGAGVPNQKGGEGRTTHGEGKERENNMRTIRRRQNIQGGTKNCLVITTNVRCFATKWKINSKQFYLHCKEHSSNPRGVNWILIESSFSRDGGLK